MGVELTAREDLARKLKTIGLTTTEIAKRFGVARSTVQAYLSVGKLFGEEPLGACSISDPEACYAHWHDLFNEYPGGMPVVGRRVVRFIEGPR